MYSYILNVIWLDRFIVLSSKHILFLLNAKQNLYCLSLKNIFPRFCKDINKCQNNVPLIALCFDEGISNVQFIAIFFPFVRFPDTFYCFLSPQVIPLNKITLGSPNVDTLGRNLRSLWYYIIYIVYYIAIHTLITRAYQQFDSQRAFRESIRGSF